MSPTKTITNYEGLYGDEYGKYSLEYIFLELIATRSQSFDWTIKPHIHTQLFQVFIVEKGQVGFQENTLERQIQAPCIFIVPTARTRLHARCERLYSYGFNQYFRRYFQPFFRDF